MEQFPQMLYRLGGPLAWEGLTYATLEVSSADELADAKARAWGETPGEAIEIAAREKALQAAADAEQAPQAPTEDPMPSRAELEQKATELGLKFDGRNSDKKLRDMIAAALEE